MVLPVCAAEESVCIKGQPTDNIVRRDVMKKSDVAF